MKKKIANFKYPVITETDRTYGVSLGPVLREDGDWRDFLPPDEDQRVNGVESSACYVEAQQRLIATIQEEEFAIADQNYSARFNALLSDGGEDGGDPIKGALSIKKDGLIADALMSFVDIVSWAEYHSWKGVDRAEVIRLGKEWLKNWEPKYLIVAEREEPIETKYASLREALKRGPVAVSVHAWYERGGVYYKPKGKRDNHLTLAVYLDADNRIHVRDTYPPYYKILEPNTNFEFAMTWTLKKLNVEEAKKSLILQALQKLFQLLGFIQANPNAKPTDEVVIAPVERQEPPSEELPKKSLLIPFCEAIRDYEGEPGDLNYRNNNPGNCKYSPVGYHPMYGEVKKDARGFAIFKDYATGWLYLQNFVKSKIQRHPNRTIREFFYEYAPPTDGNSPELYAIYVARRLGVEVDFITKNLL